ncbi:MAG: SDR family NAD(P)-dependent oxidoreductase [Pseudomonadales bacterium]|nr:SDR family NAD(P)-dependent oxidoreductase [Pseudomonadales bacterium]
MTTLKGKTAFITGAASGIGFALAKGLVAEGANVVLADIEASALARAAAALANDRAKITTAILDVTDRAQFATARDAAIAAHGGVQLLFNNAGVNAAGPAPSLTFNDWDWVLGVNLGGVVNGVQTFLPELLRHGDKAHLVNTASVGGLLGMRALAPYNASKFGVVGLSEALRADLAPHGVRVSVLCPGIVSTALGSSARNRPDALRNADAAVVTRTEDAPSPVAMSADELAVFALTAVKEDRFWIVSHPEFRALVAQRNDALVAAYQGMAEPVKETAMRELIVPF